MARSANPKAKPATLPRKSYSAKQFYLDDQASTLFPLQTNKILVERGFDDILVFAQNIIDNDLSFLPQRRVYANKDRVHLRRTVKLDPVAEVYLYDVIFRNRTKFRKPFNEDKRHFGYRFSKGEPIAASASYANFKKFASRATFLYEEHIYFDVSSYFNGLYHHDLHAWFAALKPDNEKDIAAFGKFLREINAGRSLDCLPQGLYPSKMIGNDFLRFVEQSCNIKSEKICRFMDDIYLFDDNNDVLQKDFAHIQRLLGLKGLSVNASKTKSGDMFYFDDDDDAPVSALKQRLLRRRRNIIISHYDEQPDPVAAEGEEDASESAGSASEPNPPLDDEEIKFVKEMLDNTKLSEEDAELLLVVLRDNVTLVESHLDKFANGYPHLAKKLLRTLRGS